MNSKHQKSIGILILLLVLVMTACTPSRPGPMAWIDFSFDGAVLRSGETVDIRGHTSSLDGTTEAILFVNGAAQMSIVPEDTTADFVRVNFSWIPAEDGDYTLELRMVSGAGEPGASEPVRVRVGRTLVVVEPEAEETGVATPTLVVTPAEGITPVLPVTPTLTATIDIPLTSTATVTSRPSDTTPPPVPSPMVPADGLTIGCGSAQNLVWLPVEDPSGLNGYYVRLERELSPGNWDRIGEYGPINDKQYEVPIDCGVSFRWSVRAEDTEGNKSNWSAWSTFSVELD